MLNMSGRPLWNMVDNIAVLVLNILLNLALIPRFGIVGSAVAWAVSLGVVNLARLVQVWWTMRMLPFNAGVARGFLAGAVAFLAALLVRRWLRPPLQLPVGPGPPSASPTWRWWPCRGSVPRTAWSWER